MKKITMVIAGVLMGTLAFADTPISKTGMAIVKRDAYSFTVIYKSEEQSDVKVQIFDSNDKLVFSEVIKQSDGFARPFNFSALKEGEYKIRLDNGSNWLVESVENGLGKPRLSQVVKMNSGKYLLMVPGKGEDHVKVNIVDKDGNTFYKETQDVQDDFAKVYDLSQVTGPYSFEITDKTGTTHRINK